ncbi:hypothetical protein KVG96_14500 [Pseudomonas sp. COR58]|uniref:Phage tail protein n=1 Tax=Pseudomonas ekonensis TaxID=2842353 RepID=A0ABS6PGL5_9PSED|nr:hypothetical protein [Pseudomonas ekonensis]MBV4459167.1 hypothetical protein [Pseudomonas ekonensis]
MIDDYLRVYASYIALLRDQKFPIAGGTLTGAMNDAPPQSIASGATTDIGAATSNVVYITGTTTITNFGTIAAGARRTVRFTGVLTLTYNGASMILPTGANITTAINDSAEFLSMGSGNWICLFYKRDSGGTVGFSYNRSNIVGTVSQTAGAPTGAVIEYVTNGNGSCIKIADGTMIAWRLGAGGIGFFNTSNIGFTWTFPITFAALGYVGANLLGTLGTAKQVTAASAYARTGTSASVSVFSLAQFVVGDIATYGVDFDCIAIGRWF